MYARSPLRSIERKWSRFRADHWRCIVEVKAPETPLGPRRIVKRYSNRKLYDTKDSRYVTLLQIAELVRGGEEVQIIDNNTKDDLTEVTLAQIIYEEQKGNQKSLPLQTLKDLISQRTETVLTSLREGPIGRLIPGAKSEVSKPEDAASEVESAPEPVKAAATPIKTVVAAKPSFVDQARGTFEDFQKSVDERVEAVLPSILPWKQLELEVKRLAARVDELEAQLKKAP
jgi:polyhydroxyalkanoate synthesis repressor PhaR